MFIGLLVVKSQSQLPTDDELEVFSEPGDIVSLTRPISRSNSTIREISWYAIYPGNMKLIKNNMGVKNEYNN